MPVALPPRRPLRPLAALVVALAAAGAAAGPGPLAAGDTQACDRDLLVVLHRQLAPTVDRIAEIHFNFTGARHSEVNEIISVYHLHTLAQSGLGYLEALRQVFSVLICPQRLDFFCEPAHVEGTGVGDFVGLIGLARSMELHFDGLRHVAWVGGSSASQAESQDMWHLAEEELRMVTQRVEMLLQQVASGNGQRLGVSQYESFIPLLDRVLSMITDFLGSLAEDTSALFQPPNFVPREMLPPSPGEQPASGGLGMDIFVDSPGGTALRPAFASLLRGVAPALAQPSAAPKFRACAALAVAEPASRAALPPELSESLGSAHRDVSGVHGRRNLASPEQLLHAVARHTRLSNLFISVQVSEFLLTPRPTCGSRAVLYDPTQCLAEGRWAGYIFQLNPLPPHNVTVVYKGKALGPGVYMPPGDVHSIHVPSMDTQWSSLVSLYKSMNHHSPDMIFVNPFVGNCQIVDRLLATGSVKPKLLYLPVNPLEAPPAETIPDFFEWWREHSPVLLSQIFEGVGASSDGELPISTSIWLAQCSLSATDRLMRGHGYRLVHLEHTYAVFMWGPLFAQVFADSALVPAAGGGPLDLEPLHTAWLRGWHCSPSSRYLFELEVLAGGAAADGASLGWAARPPDRQQLRRWSAAEVKETPTLRYFLERPDREAAAGTPAAAAGLGRGRCGGGFCECLPPFRGELCELEDPPRVPQRLRAALHYITAETEQDMTDIERSLRTLWTHYNQRADYPVIIFHEGLSPKARQRIVDASDNRIWFALLPNFKQVPPEWTTAAEEMAKEFSVGYRAMTRWRSGPIFLEPALARFDYAMTLDTDSYFPADILQDPFELLHQEGWVAAFPHLGRESASVVVNFMHHFLLYCRLHGLHPRRTEVLQSLIEKNFKWYQQCLMLDIEVLRLDWFRGEAYQDFFRYMDASGGFWLQRWGNNPVRTFGVGLLLDDSQVRFFELPYAHQEYCSCGNGAAACQLDRATGERSCSGPAGNIGVSSLADHLMDLQPWRGTDRQKEKFKPDDVLEFVEEQFGPIASGL